MEIKGENIVFLLGAGASYDANIPISIQMVKKIEELIATHKKWMQYEDLYNYLKSSILYGDGIFGEFEKSFNIERLLIVITEIEKRDKNIMYPFIGTWNIRLTDLAGKNFENLNNFKELISLKLNEWVKLKDYSQANYYEGFTSLKNEIGNLLHVFTLNYDLCFERVVGKNQNIELGFNNTTKEWHYSNFDSIESKDFFLYKLHGSINWYHTKDKIKKLMISDDPVETPQLIFGIEHKMTSTDPYFFFSSEFRKKCLDSETKLLICLGYSFSDEYINNIISQAVLEKDETQILVVSSPNNEKESMKTEISNKLNIERESIIIETVGAKKFLNELINKNYLAELIHDSKEAPF